MLWGLGALTLAHTSTTASPADNEVRRRSPTNAWNRKMMTGQSKIKPAVTAEDEEEARLARRKKLYDLDGDGQLSQLEETLAK